MSVVLIRPDDQDLWEKYPAGVVGMSVSMVKQAVESWYLDNHAGDWSIADRVFVRPQHGRGCFVVRAWVEEGTVCDDEGEIVDHYEFLEFESVTLTSAPVQVASTPGEL